MEQDHSGQMDVESVSQEALRDQQIAAYIKQQVDAKVGAVEQQQSEMMNQMVAAQAQMATLLQQLLSKDTATASTSSQPAPPLVQPAQPAINSKDILPKPSTFGGDKTTFPAWKRYMMCKITTDVQDNRELRVNYISAFCSGEAASFTHNFIERSPSCTFSDVLEHLSNRYEDPQKQENAMRKLNELKMQTLSFESFVSKFETLESESGASTWPETARVQNFKNKLSPWLRDLTVLGIRPEEEKSLAVYVQRLRIVVNRHNEAKGHSNKNTQALPRIVSSAAPTPDAGDPMDWTKTNAVGAGNQNWKKNRPFAPTYTEKEYLARVKAKACTTCGNKGHFANRCQYQRAKNQPQFMAQKVNTNVASTNEFAFQKLAEDVEEDLDSGNEGPQ